VTTTRIMLSALLATVASTAIARLDARVQQPSRDDAVKVTVIGCVERSAPIPEPGATTAIPADETRYVLSKITLVPPERGAPAASLGNAIEQAVPMYRLDDGAAAKIAPHVGDRVQVTGTLVKRPPAPTGTSGQMSPSGPAANAPLLRVESLTKIDSDAASCPK
jgi:hypothetical protein